MGTTNDDLIDLNIKLVDNEICQLDQDLLLADF